MESWAVQRSPMIWMWSTGVPLTSPQGSIILFVSARWTARQHGQRGKDNTIHFPIMITKTAQSRFVRWPRHRAPYIVWPFIVYVKRSNLNSSEPASIHPAWKCPWWINPNWHVITRDSFFFCCSWYVDDDDGDFGTHSCYYPPWTAYFGRDNTF